MLSSFLSKALVVAAFVSAVAADVDPIVVKGSKFFYKTNGTEFFMRGVAYQQEYSGNGTSATSMSDYKDPLADSAGCQRDLPYLQALRTNTIRVYAIDPTANHDACMTMLQNAGIYVVADLSAPSESINRDTPIWDTDLLKRYTSVVDALQKYNNVLGFFGGNEVSNNNTNTAASPFVKAAIRDVKAYIKNKGYRTIPVGYATSDDAQIRLALANYFNCGDNQANAIDFWGYNIYSWCGSDSSYTISGYDQRTAEFANYSVPVFFAEYGCNTPSPRVFDEVQAIYSKPMTDTWSGGIVYMYFQEANNYGLVTLNGNSISPRPDFTALSSQIAKVNPTGVQSGSYNPTNTAPRACPATQTSRSAIDAGTFWNASPNLPPSPNADLCTCMVSQLSCVVSSSLDPTKYGDLFNYLFSQNSNAGIVANGTVGNYGAYSMCTAQQKLSWAFNNYYVSQRSASTACNFGGAGKLQSPGSKSSSCSSLLSAAGDIAGTRTVVNSATGGSSSSGSGASHTAAAGMVAASRFEFGSLKIAASVVAAFLSGAGLLLL